MPTDTSIPCSKEVRDLVRSHKKYERQTYDDLLQDAFEEWDGYEEARS